MVRALLLATLSAVAALVPGGSLPPDGGTADRATPRTPARAPASASAWVWPLAPDPAVVATFLAPPTPWSAGHRGVDLAAAVGQPVLSAGRGQVTFSGLVAGRGVVVVRHRGDLRTTYEPVDRRATVGTMVQPGSPIGVVGATPGHCAPATCLHWGLRRADRYLDPLLLVGAGPPVLLPVSRR